MVEAHGTGTKLGDPIEFEALTHAFRKDTDNVGYCALGSVKTNIGHTMTSAGIAGLARVLLALKHRRIPPSLHYEKANGQLRMQGSPFFVNSDLVEWEVPAGGTRLGAVSSFGFSGTNAHMVIGEAPEPTSLPVDTAPYPVMISARTQEQLHAQVRRLLAALSAAPECRLADVSFTLLRGRRHLGHRLGCVARDTEDLVSLLSRWVETGRADRVQEGRVADDHKDSPSQRAFGNECLAHLGPGCDAETGADLLRTVVDLYVQGCDLDLASLFSPAAHRIVPLPGYPFARERYWGVGARESSADVPAATVQLHPLVQRNTSDLGGLPVLVRVDRRGVLPSGSRGRGAECAPGRRARRDGAGCDGPGDRARRRNRRSPSPTSRGRVRSHPTDPTTRSASRAGSGFLRRSHVRDLLGTRETSTHPSCTSRRGAGWRAAVSRPCSIWTRSARDAGGRSCAERTSTGGSSAWVSTWGRASGSSQ